MRTTPLEHPLHPRQDATHDQPDASALELVGEGGKGVAARAIEMNDRRRVENERRDPRRGINRRQHTTVGNTPRCRR